MITPTGSPARDSSPGSPRTLGLRSGGIAVALGAAVAGMSAAQGGYFPTSWNWAALGLFWAAGLVLAVRVELSRAEAAVLGLLAALTGWTALSLAWTVSIPQSVDEVERALVYVAGAAAFLFVARRDRVVTLLGAVLGGLTGVCAYALATRLFPNELSADVFGGYRLSTPVGYWNGLELRAATGQETGDLRDDRAQVWRRYPSC